jgi:hypothetical protein
VGAHGDHEVLTELSSNLRGRLEVRHTKVDLSPIAVKNASVGQEADFGKSIAGALEADKGRSVVDQGLVELTQPLLYQTHLHLVSSSIDSGEPDHGPLGFVKGTLRVPLIEQHQCQARPDLTDTSVEAGLSRDLYRPPQS